MRPFERYIGQQAHKILCAISPPRGEEILITSLKGEGESENFEKGGGSMVQGKVFLKGGGLALFPFHFSFFKVYQCHFYI